MVIIEFNKGKQIENKHFAVVDMFFPFYNSLQNVTAQAQLCMTFAQALQYIETFWRQYVYTKRFVECFKYLIL